MEEHMSALGFEEQFWTPMQQSNNERGSRTALDLNATVAEETFIQN